MTQCSGVLSSLPEDLRVVPSTHTGCCIPPVTPTSRGQMSPSFLYLHTCAIYSHRCTHVHKNKNILKCIFISMLNSKQINKFNKKLKEHQSGEASGRVFSFHGLHSFVFQETEYNPHLRPVVVWNKLPRIEIIVCDIQRFS